MNLKETEALLQPPALYVPPKEPGRLRKAWRWIAELWWLWFLSTVAILVLWGVLVICDHQVKEQEAWMAECQQERKHYECVALWRQGENHSQVIPVFIPVAH